MTTTFLIGINLAAALIPGNPLAIVSWVVIGIIVGLELASLVNRPIG